MDESNITISANKTLIVLVHGFRSSPWTGVVADLGKCKSIFYIITIIHIRFKRTIYFLY